MMQLLYAYVLLAWLYTAVVLRAQPRTWHSLGSRLVLALMIGALWLPCSIVAMSRYSRRRFEDMAALERALRAASRDL